MLNFLQGNWKTFSLCAAGLQGGFRGATARQDALAKNLVAALHSRALLCDEGRLEAIGGRLLLRRQPQVTLAGQFRADSLQLRRVHGLQGVMVTCCDVPFPHVHVLSHLQPLSIDDADVFLLRRRVALGAGPPGTNQPFGDAAEAEKMAAFEGSKSVIAGVGPRLETDRTRLREGRKERFDF